MTIKSILNIVPTIHSASLAASVAKDAKKKDKDTLDIIGSASKVLVGVPLIRAESQLIGSL